MSGSPQVAEDSLTSKTRRFMKWYRVDFAGMVESDYICAENKESAICKAFKQFAEDVLQIVEVDDSKECFPDVAVVWG